MRKYQMLLVCFISICISCQKSEKLFQKGAENWIEEGDAKWTFSSDSFSAAVNEGLGFLMTKNSYKDFVLELEFNPDSNINSGVFIRCKNYELSSEDCYEVNIWDLHPNQDFRTGAIVTKQKPLAIVQTIDQWNAYKIQIKDDHLQVWVNGVLTADLKDPTRAEGYIGLQAMGTGKISFRNVKISKLD